MCTRGTSTDSGQLIMNAPLDITFMSRYKCEIVTGDVR